MPTFRSLTGKRPLIFGLVVTFFLILLVLISSIVVGRVTSAETLGWYFGSTMGRLVSILILLAVLWGLGWLDAAGFTKLGGWRIWLILLILLEYAMVVSAYAMTGRVSFGYSDAVLAGIAAVFIMLHAFLEEISFRGLVMHSLIRAWGGRNHGVLRSILVSSLYFGGMHIIYLAGEPLPVVLLRIVVAFLLGIFFAALVLRGKSIYPAAFFHGMLNVAGYLNLAGAEGAGTPSSWLLLSLSMLPLALYGLRLLRMPTSSIHDFKRSPQTENPIL